MYGLLQESQLNIMLALSSICGSIACFVLVNKTLSKSRKTYLIVIEVSAMILLAFDRFAYIYRGDVSSAGYYMVRISNFIVFFMTLFLLFAFNLYLNDLFTNEGDLKNTPGILKLINYLFILGELLLIISQFTGIYYTFDESNHYQRSSAYIISYIFPMLILVLQLLVIVKNRKRLSKKIFISLFLFAFVPLVASLVQLFAYGLSLTNISLVGLTILLYVFALMDMNETVGRANKIEIEYLKDQQKSTKRLFEQTATALVNAIDAKDKYTHGHSSRVAEYSRKIAIMCGKSEKEVNEVYYAALLHDVGKIGIKDEIINKTGKLNEEEYEQIRQHPVIGRQILSGISEFQYLSIGANYHHERFDGRGYPEKLKGKDIPEIARIDAVADAYDAMSSRRSYRDPIPQQKIREEFVKGSGTQFDPDFAKMMIHLIDLDAEYEMQEKEEVKELSGKNELICDEYRSEISEGIVMLKNITTIQLKSAPQKTNDPDKYIPSIVLFDSLDGRVYTDEKMKKDMVYCEYGEVRFDGTTVLASARKVKVEHKENKIGKKLLSEVANAGDRLKNNEVEYILEGVKVEDHVLIRIMSQKQTIEITVALPDSTRYCYLGLTGEYCTISDVTIDKAEEFVEDNYIERIAEEISYINGDEGDVPNIQVNNYRTAATAGIPIEKEITVKFHTMSLPTSRLVWHCPYLVIFNSDDGLVNGENYREFALIRLDGENWETGGFAENKLTITKNDDFEDWDAWKEYNKKGYDVTVSFKREGRNVITVTENFGILIRNVTTVNSDIKNIYISLTGDQCAITNIRFFGVENTSDITREKAERVKSTVVKVQGNGAGMDSALDMTERLAEESGLSPKQMLHLRLLSEELMGMVRSIAGNVEAEYWLETEGRDYELYLKSELVLSDEMKTKFALASSGKTEVPSKGFMSRLRYLIAESMFSSENAESVSEWSLEQYKREVKKNKQDSAEAMNAWDELEKSIIVNVADEVKVKILRNNVEIVVYKSLS